MEEKDKYLILIDAQKFQQKILNCVTTKEVDKFFDNTIFADDKKYKQAMIYGMCIASMMTSDCEPLFLKCR